jgi:hypothetical protein
MTEPKKSTALIDIAIVRGYNYAQEYDPNSGVTKDRNGYHYLKQGFVDGFLAGFAHRLGGGHADS